jgi:uncharacterized integral membrane protein
MTAAQNHPDLTPDTGQADQSNASSPTPGRPAVSRSRIVGLWVASMLFAFVLLLLLIFVLENGQRAEVSLFGVHGHLPMGVALLLAAIFGVLLVALSGTARIVQLRTLEHRRKPRAGTRPARRSVPPAWDDTPRPESTPLAADSAANRKTRPVELDEADSPVRCRPPA